MSTENTTYAFQNAATTGEGLTQLAWQVSVTCKSLLDLKPKLLIPWAATLCATFIAMIAQAADKKPNVIMIMMDDVGWSDFGWVARDGMVFPIEFSRPLDVHRFTIRVDPVRLHFHLPKHA
jgi:hypothetical protein